MSNTIHLIGGGTVGRRLADRLEIRGDSVQIIEHDEERAQLLEKRGYRVHHGDGTDISTLDGAGIVDADIVVVATGSDDSNLLAAQLVRSRFEPESVITRVNRRENADPFEELGITTVSRSDATAKMLDSHLESPAMTRWMETIGDRGDIQEVAIANPDYVGLTIAELDERLSEQVLLLMVGDEVDAHLPDRDETVEHGDHVTLIGSRDAVREAMDELSDESSPNDIAASTSPSTSEE
ncbi:potassium channel family protein [Halosimplex aquaticum]|uniref:Potassium channel family protein n=1 Tax=Halosimplex aquaticum TaxID=3026162 RepID=A0ABD5XYR9_9EURY|nr:TrkA family potassium uptake protein [Halosimplex aquaticum]